LLAVNEALRCGDLDAAKKLIARYAAGESGNLFWLRCAAVLGIHLGELDWYEPWLAKLPMPGAFAFVFLADYAFAREEWSKAADLYAGAFARSAMPGWLVREGECRRRLGDRESARALWRRALAVRPWQINLLLRLRDLERGSDIPGDPPPGRGEILLYSWNHGPDLDKTLAALAASALGGCGLTVLDNGSSDNTPAVIRSWQERFGGRMKTLALPVNVGAPAARNWLLSLESSKAADWVVFLDDDALVPPDWLGYFGTALRLHPEAGIVGCRVVDMDAPMTMQSVDLHFERAASKAQEPPKPGPQDERTSRFSGGNMVNTHVTVPDFGQYKYLRTAVSVTGCCHLLTRENLEEVGDFDLRFSPSQFDDLERDLRSCLKGKFCLYQGHLAVRHSKRSGVAARISPRQQADVTGNLSKLRAGYTPEQMDAIVEEDMRRLREDLTTGLSDPADPADPATL
jgi:GT2 family glycosyltransferase